MRPDIQQFLTRIEAAFQRVTTASPAADVADALAYMNLIQSAGGRGHCEQVLRSLGITMIQGLPVTVAHPAEGLCFGRTTVFDSPLYWIEDFSKLAKDRHGNHELMRKQLKKSLSGLKRKILWLTDLDGRKLDSLQNTPEEATSLCLGLALFGKAFNYKMIICEVQASRLHKPTWVDAGFAFYWYAAPDKNHHGQTRDLSTGHPRFKEWVVLKENVDIRRWRSIVAPDSGHTINRVEHLTPDYLDQCRQEVTLSRNMGTDGTEA